MEESEHIKKVCLEGKTLYVSDEGQIWGVSRRANQYGEKGKLHKMPVKYDTVYPYIKLRSKDWRRQVKVRIHALVWKAFNGEKPIDMEIDHIDNDTRNFRLSNLQLLTRSQNILKSYATGGGGYRCLSVKVSLPDTEFYQVFHSINYAAKQIGCAPGNLRIRLASAGPEGIDIKGCHVEFYNPDKIIKPCDTRARKQRYADLKQRKPSSTFSCDTSQ